MNSKAPQLSNSQYGVGWIAALPHERAAAEAMLETFHAPPQYKHENDHNTYTLGSINGPNGEHNIVIASLPPGQYGTTPAATAAMQMLSSFPAIKFGLMVGIGGGIPSVDNDVRLGDVVVSQPEGTFGGVRQYDCGKATIDGFEERGALNCPPRVLLNAMGALQSQHERKGSAIPGILRAMYDDNPLMVKPRTGPGYVFQGANNDRLFQSDYIHQSNRKDCSSCDNAKKVIRPERSDEDPFIHYGTIASGNEVIKDARKRDMISGNCLCFETEAAGLMNDFPCIVIRGICDYCDSHKNDQWQKYAAGTAAAYTKELLQATDVADVKVAPEAREVVQEMQKILEHVSHIQQQAKERFENIQEEQNKRQRQEILNWISTIDYGPQYSDIIRQRHSNTGQWLLDSSEYQTWLKSKGQTMFCPGIPGAGKTVLSAIVIHDICSRLQDMSSTGIAYIFCSFKRQNEQMLDKLMLSLSKQLMQRQDSMPEYVTDIYHKHKDNKTNIPKTDVMELTKAVVAMYSKVFIVIDALDECQAAPGCRNEFLLKLFDLQANNGVNIFATSRFIKEIEVYFRGHIQLEIRANHMDVQKYLDGKLRNFGSLVSKDTSLQVEIKTRISNAVDGMFLLAQLYVDSLTHKATRKAIRKALDDLLIQTEAASDDDRKFKALDRAYSQAMERIHAQAPELQELATNALSWITFAKRALTTSELQHALAVEVAEPELDLDNIPDIDAIISACAGLIIVDEESAIIRLVHYTTQDYFRQTWHHWFPNVETYITKQCVSYLSFDTFQTGICRSKAEFEARTKSHSLYRYAAENWGYHACSSSRKDVHQLCLNFLESESKVSACRQTIQISQNYFYGIHFPQGLTALHLTAYFGLEELSTALLERGAIPYPEDDSRNTTPLHLAVENGHEAVVNLLLDEGFDPRSRNEKFLTPLGLAVRKAPEPVVMLLLDKCINNPTIKENLNLEDLLHYAVKREHEAAVQLLLENGAKPNSSYHYMFDRPLLKAVDNGHEAMVKLLLENGADPNGRVDSLRALDQTPLCLASKKGRETIVKILLDRGADPNFCADGNWTPLCSAVESGDEPVVNPLLDNGAGSHSVVVSGMYLSPLCIAAKSGDLAVVRALLNGGADPNMVIKDKYKSGNYLSPLHFAAKYGHETVVKMLLEWNANPDSIHGEGETPLHCARREGHAKVVNLLSRT